MTLVLEGSRSKINRTFPGSRYVYTTPGNLTSMARMMPFLKGYIYIYIFEKPSISNCLVLPGS